MQDYEKENSPTQVKASSLLAESTKFKEDFPQGQKEIHSTATPTATLLKVDSLKKNEKQDINNLIETPTNMAGNDDNSRNLVQKNKKSS